MPRQPSNASRGVGGEPVPGSGAASGASPPLSLKKGVEVDLFTENDWWQAKAKSKPDAAGFVHLGYLNGSTEDDVALLADSPRIRAAQDPTQRDCAQEKRRAQAGDDVVLWSEYLAARKEGAPPATGGALAQLRLSLAGPLAALQAFVPSEGVAFTFPSSSELVDELARAAEGRDRPRVSGGEKRGAAHGAPSAATVKDQGAPGLGALPRGPRVRRFRGAGTSEGLPGPLDPRALRGPRAGALAGSLPAGLRVTALPTHLSSLIDTY
jgi:hypothetical protein